MIRTAAMTTRRHRRRAGFTLVETLVVISIIALLLGLLTVAITGAFTRGRAAAAEQFMTNIAFAIEQFKADFGYYPPLLNDAPTTHAERYLLEAQSDALNQLQQARFNSILSLPVYLVGVGQLARTGPYDPLNDPNPDRHDGVSGPGLRDPGQDKSWGGAVNRTRSNASRTGRTYGPYMDVGASENFRLVTIDDLTRPVPAPETAFSFVEGMYVFVDRGGNPIRYYTGWPTLDTSRPPQRTLDRVPVELLSSRLVEGLRVGGQLDAAEDRTLLTAPFALLSAGKDGIFASANANPMAGDPEPFGFVTRPITSAYSNSSLINGLSDEDRAELVRTLSDNIRVTP